MSATRICGVLLAAGAGTRFGGGKLIHPLDDGVPIAAHAARNLVAAGLDVVAVIRPGDFPLADLLEEEGCFVTHCADAIHGMGHTLAHGVANSRDADGWVIALADMPRVQPATIQRVASAISAGDLIAAPRFNGERGHPVGFRAQLRDELLRLTGDTGARPVLEQHREAMRFLDCDDPGVVLDIDVKADLPRIA